MRNHEIFLIPTESKKTAGGAPYKDVKSANRRLVFGDVSSVGMREHYTAESAGKNVTRKVVIYQADYNEETLLEHNGKQYEVERNYAPNTMDIELYCKRVEGT